MADGGRRDGDLAVAYGEAQADDELRCRRHSYLGAEREVRIDLINTQSGCGGKENVRLSYTY